MKNIMIVDYSQPYAFDIHRVSDADYGRLFPPADVTFKLAGEFRKRKDIEALQDVFKRMWYRRVASNNFKGIDGVIIYESGKLPLSNLAVSNTQSPARLPSRNIMLFECSPNQAFHICAATEDEFQAIFPQAGQDVEFQKCLCDRAGTSEANGLIESVRSRAVPPSQVFGIEGTLYLGCKERIALFPNKKDSDAPRYYPIHDE